MKFSMENRYKKNCHKNWLYTKWYHMKSRCYNPKTVSYKYYGERGIKVEDWLLDFNNYIDYIISILPKGATVTDMRKFKWSIDRIDNDENYKRGNLKWSSQREQGLNRRIQKNNKSGYRGVSWYSQTKKWVATICVNKKVFSLGYYNTKEEAFAVYLEAVKKRHGQKAYEHVLLLHPNWGAA